MTVLDGFIATTRFGMGAAPGELNEAASDPRGWLISQIAPHPLPPTLAAQPGSDELYDEFKEIQLERKEVKAGTATPNPGAPRLRDLYVTEVAARTNAAIASATPLDERLALFWSNHFTVSTARGQVILPLAGAFEREAIRPHIYGTFHEMLRAVTGHPAMLLYLDNASSVGPDSRAGQRSHRGINENLGREMLELHTLGVDGGYTQADVDALADILTGWSVAGPKEQGAFMWRANIHEPGDKTLLGTTIADGGMEEGEQAIALLAGHPSTARHLATQLVRHFIADNPPPAAVEAVAETYLRTGGDLAQVTRAVIERPEAWSQPLPKVKSPNDFVVSTFRALGAPPVQDPVLVQSLRLLGQAPFSAPQPEGWPDDAAGWMAPEALMRRIEWSQSAAHRLPGTVPDGAAVQQIADQSVGPVLSANSRSTISEAGKPPQQLAMLFSSPEFQRR